MVDYMVRYTLDGYIYETVVRTASSGAAIRWVETQVIGASKISVVGPTPFGK